MQRPSSLSAENLAEVQCSVLCYGRPDPHGQEPTIQNVISLRWGRHYRMMDILQISSARNVLPKPTTGLI